MANEINELTELAYDGSGDAADDHPGGRDAGAGRTPTCSCPGPSRWAPTRSG